MLFSNKKKPVVNICNLEIKDHHNKVKNNIEVNIFETIEKEKIAKVIRWQMAKARLGTHNTKDVSELAYSTKKLRKQKGGGCARFRNKGATQFRGGATVHGPDDRIYSYSINKKEKLLGLKHALGLKVHQKEILILEKIDLASTVRSLKEFCTRYDLDLKKSSFLIIDNEKKENILKAINNIHNVNYLPLTGVNVQSIIKNEKLILSEDALMQLKAKGVL